MTPGAEPVLVLLGRGEPDCWPLGGGRGTGKGREGGQGACGGWVAVVVVGGGASITG